MEIFKIIRPDFDRAVNEGGFSSPSSVADIVVRLNKILMKERKNDKDKE